MLCVAVSCTVRGELGVGYVRRICPRHPVRMEGEGFEMVVILPLRRFGFVSFLGLISTLVTFAACSFGRGALSSGVFWLAMAKVCVVSSIIFSIQQLGLGIVSGSS